MSDSREYPARPILAASTAVFRDGKVLLGARRNHPAAGMFSLPGGVVEAGETLEQAALRELMEETGVEAKIIGFNDHVEVVQKDEDGRVRRHFVVASFVGRWISGEGVPNEDLGELIWADPAAIHDLPTTSGLPRIVERALAILEGRA